MNAFIQQWCIQLIKSDRKDIYIDIKNNNRISHSSNNPEKINQFYQKKEEEGEKTLSNKTVCNIENNNKWFLSIK